jgi:hypothetical protein
MQAAIYWSKLVRDGDMLVHVILVLDAAWFLAVNFALEL